MDLSQRALQADGMLCTNFILVFELLAENRKTIKFTRGVNINQSAMCYISMDSSQQALQTNENHIAKEVCILLKI